MKIAHIGYTISGEFPDMGKPSLFIRLGGCNLRCWKSSGYCDAPHTLKMDYEGYHDMMPENLVFFIADHYTSTQTKHITITGGEPLLFQDEIKDFQQYFLRAEQRWIIETSGSIRFDPSDFVSNTIFVVDVKCPSTEMEKHHSVRPKLLSSEDVLKFVIADWNDFQYAMEFYERYEQEWKAQTVFTPRWGHLDLSKLAGWVMNEAPFAKIGVQLHKYIWPQCHPEEVESLEEVDFAEAKRNER